MYATFRCAGTPLPLDNNLVDYGLNIADEEVFQQAAAAEGGSGPISAEEDYDGESKDDGVGNDE